MTDDRDADPLAPRPIEPSAPAAFGLVQAWWGDGKGKTTAALGMALRAAGHGYRVHVVQFMKGGTASVEDVRGEYNAIAALPGVSLEHSGHYGWAGALDASADAAHAEQAEAGLERVRDLLDAAGGADLTAPIPLDADPEAGMHMLVLDEVLYAVEMGLLDAEDVCDLLDRKPDDLELVLTGGHERPDFLDGRADLVTNVRKEAHPIEDGQGARKGTEF